MGFWTTEIMRQRLSDLIEPYNHMRIENCAYALSMGPEGYVTGGKARTKTLLNANEQLAIPPGQFAQLLTEEEIRIPDDCLGFISVKTRYKFGGLVNVSGFHVDPGFRGRLIFSVYNAGATDVVVTRGNPLFLLWFATLEGATSDIYKGKRDQQQHLRDEDMMRLHGEVSSPQALATRIGALEERVERRISLRRDALIVLLTVAATAIVSWIIGNVDIFEVIRAGSNG